MYGGKVWTVKKTISSNARPLPPMPMFTELSGRTGGSLLNELMDMLEASFLS
jgi:hypothetical protein